MDFLKTATGFTFMSKMMKFPLVPRIWVMVMIMVNMAALYFIDTLEGQVVIGVFMVSAAMMIIRDAKMGFVKLLGLGHVLWLGLVPWLYFRLDGLSPDTLVYQWIMVVIAINGISLIIDIRDVVQYVKGDRAPVIE